MIKKTIRKENMEDYNKQVAQTIKGQISKYQLMCYAARDFTYVGSDDKLPGLKFTVSGTSVLKNRKGTIEILLNGADLYDITFSRKNKDDVVKNDVYAEDLNGFLDILLETEEYQKNINPNIVGVKLVEVNNG